MFQFIHEDFPHLTEYFETQWEAENYAINFASSLASSHSAYKEEMKKVKIFRISPIT